MSVCVRVYNIIVDVWFALYNIHIYLCIFYSIVDSIFGEFMWEVFIFVCQYAAIPNDYYTPRGEKSVSAFLFFYFYFRRIPTPLDFPIPLK